MKQLLSSIFLLAIAYSGYGQVVINLADIAPIGTSYALGVDTMVGPAIVAGSGGVGQTWNFSSANTIYIDSLKIVAPASTPYSGNFPASTFCSYRLTFGDTLFFYVAATSADMKAVGIVLDPLQTGNNFIIAPTPPSKIMTFPYQMGSSYSDTSYGEVYGAGADLGQPAIDSFRYKSLNMRNVMVDGEGALTLANGTFSVLREKEISRVKDSIWVKFLFGGWSLFQDTDVTDSSYRWISDSLGLNIAELSFDSLGNEKELQFYDPNPPIVSRIKTMNQNLVFFPNPANNYFVIEHKDAMPATLAIRDISGQIISESILFSGKNEVETSSLSSGIYFLELKGRERDEILTGKLVVRK